MENYANNKLPGCVLEADLGITAFYLSFETNDTLTYMLMRGLQAGDKETVQYKKSEIRPNVYMISWQESDKTTITMIEDFETLNVYASITTPYNELINLRGTLKPVGGSICPVSVTGYSAVGPEFSINNRNHLLSYARSFYDDSLQELLNKIRVRLCYTS